MKYYVVSDVHGFYTPLMDALQERGFFDDTEPHKLIVCGDLFDRGHEALKLQNFILELMDKDEVILVRGNHEDLMLNMIDELHIGNDILYSHHQSNGTVSTAKQLVKKGTCWIVEDPVKFGNWISLTPFVKRIIPSMKNYFETEHYIFVHGWIPCTVIEPTGWFGSNVYKYDPQWRDAGDKEWKRSRWWNGMDLAHYHNIIEPNKTIVCGHWHASYGHRLMESRGSEFGKDADFSPYYGKGIIAIDGCTNHSGVVNCLIIND